MKAFLIHLVLLAYIIILGVLIGLYYEYGLPWLISKRIVGATWLYWSCYETTLGWYLSIILWLIGLAGMPWRYHLRFRRSAMVFTQGIIGLFVSTLTMLPLSYSALILYDKGLWYLALPFRILEICIAIAVLIGLLLWLFMLIRVFTMSPIHEDENGTE